MTARAVEDASSRIAALQLRLVECGVLAAAAFVAALAASSLRPDLAVPLLLGGFWAAFVAMREFVRRHLLLEDLAVDPDAHAIPAVRRLALRSSSWERRRHVAASIRRVVDSSCGRVGSVEAHRELLQELAASLVDERLSLYPAAAAALDRLTVDGWDVFYGSSVPPDELGSRLQRILGGFAPLEPQEERSGHDCSGDR